MSDRLSQFDEWELGLLLKGVDVLLARETTNPTPKFPRDAAEALAVELSNEAFERVTSRVSELPEARR